MPKFKPGQSGNPSGRPKSAAGLRELLLNHYGANAEVLVQRLEKLSTGRNSRLALDATRLLLSYACGKPEQAVEVSGRFENGRFEQVSADVLARLSNEELAVLQRISLAQHAGDAQA